MLTRPRLRAAAGVVALVAIVFLGGAVMSGLVGQGRVPSPSSARSSAPPTMEPPQALPSPEFEPDDAEREPALSELADASWVMRLGSAGAIPERALMAYSGASIRMSEERPSCGLGWNTLAAIGHVESEHGTLYGGSIGANGVLTPSLVGVALNGDGVAAIGDTDAGAIDGDARWDRAVGPMQFIPSTWAVHARDADGDGIAHIHNIDDAALTAAHYLCDAGGDLAQPQNWITAIAAYNQSVEYNNRVADAANFYASLR